MFQETFSRFYGELEDRVAARVRSARIPWQDVEDVIQDTWAGFWNWLIKREDRNPENHVGMLLEFAGWRIKDYFGERSSRPTVLEMPESIAAWDHSVTYHIQEEQESTQSQALFEELGKRSGGNILRLLEGAADGRDLRDPFRRYGFVRGYMEHELCTAERAAVSAELVAELPSRQCLDSGVNRLTKSWDRLAPGFGIRPLARARASPLRKQRGRPGFPLPFARLRKMFRWQKWLV